MCPFCNAGWHHECLKPVVMKDNEDLYVCCCDTGEDAPVVLGVRQKEGEDMQDVISTGRKRAALAKPINEGDICEWANLKYAGGGVYPIIGCNGKEAKHRHHGPDKSTLNNGLDNLHAVCTSCHNRWHASNDPYYGERPEEGKPFLPLNKECIPHDPNTEATLEEMFNAEADWQSGKGNARVLEEGLNG